MPAWIIIGLTAGWLIDMIGDAGIGLVPSLFVGIWGAILGGWMFSLTGLDGVSSLGSLIGALLGAFIAVAIVTRIKIAGE